MKKMILFVLIFFLSWAGIAQNAGKINIKKGEKFIVNLEVKAHTVTSAMGQDMETDLSTSNTYKIIVDDSTDDHYKLTETLIKFKANINMMERDNEYDSEKPDTSSSLAQELKGILNNPQSFGINQQGKIIEAPAPSSALSPMLQQFTIAGSGIKETFLLIPPNLNVGDSFQINHSDSTFGTNSALKYIVSSINGTIATLSFSGTSKTDKTIENMGMEIHTVSEGLIDGETIVNLKSGVVQAIKSKTKSTGKANVLGQEMPVTSVVTSDITVTETE
ncbi:MAG: hypothetical protein JST17_12135 [Bacteroidetes bacterium]|nr:hypothetical protein [Bacteroidota bacterium]MBS1932195.1 hypothetical protein [Bacteroidota bacterium]